MDESHAGACVPIIFYLFSYTTKAHLVIIRGGCTEFVLALGGFDSRAALDSAPLMSPLKTTGRRLPLSTLPGPLLPVQLGTALLTWEIGSQSLGERVLASVPAHGQKSTSCKHMNHGPAWLSHCSPQMSDRSSKSLWKWGGDCHRVPPWHQDQSLLRPSPGHSAHSSQLS